MLETYVGYQFGSSFRDAQFIGKDYQFLPFYRDCNKRGCGKILIDKKAF